MAVRETSLKAFRGRSRTFRGQAKIDGLVPTFAANGDLLTFQIADSNYVTVLTKTTGAGVTQSDDGTYLVSLSDEDLKLPGTGYRYEMTATLAEDGRTEVLAYGPLELIQTPHSA